MMVKGDRPVVNGLAMDELYPTHPQALQRAFEVVKAGQLPLPYCVTALYYENEVMLAAEEKRKWF